MIDLIEIKPKCELNLIKETLSRIGIPNKKEKILYPSCYVYEKNDKVYIVHFKELFILRSPNSYHGFNEDDLTRKLSIIRLLEKWELIEPIEIDDFETSYIFIVSHKDKKNWRIHHKFNLQTLE